MDATSREIRRLHTTLLLVIGISVVTLLVIFVVAPYIAHQQAIHKAELACLGNTSAVLDSTSSPCDELDRLRGQ